MKSLFATLVIVGLVSCTIASEAVNKGDYLREATTETISTTHEIPYLETEKYRSRGGEVYGKLGEIVEEEEDIFGKSHSRVAGGRASKKSNALDKLLKGGDVYKSPLKRDREVHGKKKHMLGGEEVLLTRDIKNEDELLEEAEIENEELFRIIANEKKDKLRERDLVKKHATYQHEEEDVGALKRNRGVVNPRRKYEESTLEYVKGPVHKKVLGERRIGENELSFNIKIDEDEIDELVEDFEDFSDKYLKKTKKERKVLMKKLNEAFRTTAGKMILNFGKIFPPVVQSWVEVMRHVQVNPECDQNKAVKCLDPMEGFETLYFNPKCLEKYQCHFEIEDIDPQALRLKMDNVTRNYERVNRFFNSIHVENMKKVRPSFDKYLEKASGLHEEFAELLKEHGAKILGCEESCIEDCLDTSFVTFWEIPMCLKNCKCKYGLISIERAGTSSQEDSIFGDRAISGDERLEEEGILGKIKNVYPNEKTLDASYRRYPIEHKHKRAKREFNLPELMKYSEYDRKAWNFFKKYQDDI